MEVDDRLMVYEQPLIFGKRQYRAPFKVDFVSWNPFSELVALASKKGDIVLKRSGWKKCWRISVSQVVDPLAAVNAEEQRSIDCLSWSPCGDILAVGMTDGHVHLVEIDHGNVRWTKLITDPSGTPPRIQNLRWFSHSTSPYTEPTGVYSDESKAMVPLVDGEKEWMASCRELEQLYNKKLKGTLLFACRDDLKITILAGGIVTVAVIDLAASLEYLQLCPLMLYDVLYSNSTKSLAVSVTTYGPRPHCGGDGTFGVPVVPENAVTQPHTHVVHYPIEFRDEPMMWLLTDRYVRLFSRYTNVVETLNLIVKDWGTQKQIFVNRLTPSARNLNLGANLVSFCVNGKGSPLGDAYVEKTLAAGLNGMREFLEIFFNNVLIGLRGVFTDAVRSLVFHLEQFKSKVQRLTAKERRTKDQILFPPRNFDVNVYPYEARVQGDAEDPFSHKINILSDSIERLCVSFQKTAILATTASVGNMRELLLFVRWISIFPQLMKNNKKGMAAMGQSGKVEVRPLLEYLIKTFVEDEEERETLLRYSFNVDDIVKSQTEYEKNRTQARPKYAPTKDDEPQPSMSRGEQGTPTTRRKNGAGKKARREEETPEWHAKLDKVSELWASPADFSEQLLNLIGPSLIPLDRDEPHTEKANLAQQISSLKALMRNIHSVFEEMCLVKKPNWLCELASDPIHRGFTRVQLAPFIWYPTPLPSSAVDGFKRREMLALNDAICVGLHDDTKGQYQVILPANEGERFSGLQEDLAVEMKSGCKVTSAADENEENMADGGRLLTIEIPKDEFGELVKIHDIKLHVEGFFFALVTTKSDSQGELRRLLRGHPVFKNEFHVHEMPFRHDQFESMAFMSSNMFASFLSDDATRMSTFCTLPLEPVIEDKAKEAEEYRRYTAERDRVNRPPEYFHVFDGNKVLRVQADE